MGGVQLTESLRLDLIMFCFFSQSILKCSVQVLVEEIDYEDEDSVKQATDLLLQKELTVAQEVTRTRRSRRNGRGTQVISPIVQVIQEHNVEQEIIQAEDDFKIIEHADIAMDENLGIAKTTHLRNLIYQH